VDPSTQEAIDWLLASDEPAIRGMARRDLLDEADPPDLGRVLDGPLVRGLLDGQQADGGFGTHPYHKWRGAHWRLVSLVELEVPAGEPRCMAALDGWLTMLTAHKRLTKTTTTANGLPLSDASIQGNALAVACRVGAADDPRAAMLGEALLRWQWPDGGWNCDGRASGHRSSFHESLIPMWALWEWGRATGDDRATAAAQRTAELLLEHRIFRVGGKGPPIHRTWVALHYPPYWHYDFLHALLLLGRVSRLDDERASDALDLLEERRLPDGRWRPGGSWWSTPGSARAPEAVDWGGRQGQPSPMLTLNALRVLRSAGRW
jgi:hypothetical protein